MSSSGEICRDRSWPTRHLNYLPKECKLNSWTTLLVEYATTDQLPLCYQLIQDAAKRGDNVGIDEFSNFDDVTNGIFSIAEIFQARNQKTNQIQGFILIAPCLYARGFYTCIASIRVFRTTDVDDMGLARLVNLAIELTKAIDIGYTLCVIDIALCHSNLLRLLRDEAGFHVTAVIPYCVNISGVGLYWNAIMARHLGVPDKPMKSLEEIQKMIELAFPSDEITNHKDPVTKIQHQLEFLPKEYIFKCGIQAVCRLVRKEEDTILYEIMKDAMEHGDGYALYEQPTLTIFRGEILINGTCVVYEEKETKKIIGYSIICDSWFKRSRKSKIGESSLVVAKEFRGKGIGREVVNIEMGLYQDLGYQHGINDTTAGNDQMLRNNQVTSGISIIGLLQKAAYIEGKGWTDVVITSLGDIKKFFKSSRQVFEENANQQKQMSKL